MSSNLLYQWAGLLESKRNFVGWLLIGYLRLFLGFHVDWFLLVYYCFFFIVLESLYRCSTSFTLPLLKTVICACLQISNLKHSFLRERLSGFICWDSCFWGVNSYSAAAPVVFDGFVMFMLRTVLDPQCFMSVWGTLVP